MPLLLFLLLIAGCASPERELRRGTLAPPPPPPVRPGHGAPQVGQPGLQPPEYPRSPHRRVLPPTREPGLWAGDEPQASRLEPQGKPELTKAAPQREALRVMDEAEAKIAPQGDEEVIDWLSQYPRATPQQFMSKLREIYNRKEMRERFPNGFGPGK